MESGHISRPRNQTVYVKDVIPQTLLDALKDPEYDLDKLLLQQIKILAASKKELLHKRSSLLAAIQKECSSTSNMSCGPFGKDFLNLLLKDVQDDEADARRKVLGEQESVEMFKQAFADDEVSEHHLTTARAYRDSMTARLADIVLQREIIYIAMEILERSPTSLVPQHEPEMEALGLSYTEVYEKHCNECEILKKLTEWKKKPELHITEEDELFSFFSDETPESFLSNPGYSKADRLVSENVEETTVPVDTDATSALASCQVGTNDAPVCFKKTKVSSVDHEFTILGDLASDILKYEKQMKEMICLIRQMLGFEYSPNSCGIEKYLATLRMRHPKLKFKLSTKGYNFSLKVMHRTKSVVSLDMLSTLLSTNQELPAEVKEAQAVINELSIAVKRVCSKHGRCSMAFQSTIKKEKDLEAAINDAPKVDYAESLRISSNFATNMKELKRLNLFKDQVKTLADDILQEVMHISKEYIK